MNAAAFTAATISIGFLLATALPISAIATDVACNPNGTQPELNGCAYADFKKADDELNALYQLQITRLTDDANKKNFRIAQNAWIAFRDASCLYEVGERTQASGSMWPMRQMNCQTALTLKRVDELKEYVACTTAEDFCPE
jgi:uncharacterized protein YecT (DUF1311 family)